MNAKSITIHSLAHALGDTRQEVAQIEQVDSQFAAIQLPFLPELLNCYYYYQHQGDINPWIAQSINRSLAQQHVTADQINLVLFASACLPQALHDRAVLNSLLTDTKLHNATPMALSLQQCTSGLGAINVAQALIATGSAQHILVVTVDQADSQALNRIQPYGVLSDAVSSCIVSKEVEAGYAFLAYANVIDSQGLAGQDDFESRKQAANQSMDSVLSTIKSATEGLGEAAVDKAELSHICSTNFYQPLADFNAQALGLNKSQIRIDTAKAIGHCVCADPLINLADAASNIQANDLTILQAYAPGFVAHLALKALG